MIAYRVMHQTVGKHRLSTNVLCKVITRDISELELRDPNSFIHIPENALRERLASRDGIDCPFPFWLRIQVTTAMEQPVVLTPTIPNHENFHKISLRESREPELIGHLSFTSLPNIHLIPLVARDHIEVSLTYSPSSEENEEMGCWIKHIGEHETWVIKSANHWYPVPREAWVSVEPGNRIILGRTTSAEKSKRRIVPGSLVIRADYKTHVHP